MEESTETKELLVLPQKWSCQIPSGQTILEAALNAGIRLPNSCRNGVCRACMCKLLEGRIQYRIEWPGLSAEEKADAWILPCVAEAGGCLVIQAPLAVKELNAD
ncbi:2Fe-2S iron-sulfur cluster-binding protein [Undibacterium sp. SXout11W]|uniref:2Fe-2S iron-sulfur cluster-binding protein n=1 Tax=Undibacterium sp. SXout11W TaxID=3413050 RepID=UPI003BF3D258